MKQERFQGLKLRKKWWGIIKLYSGEYFMMLSKVKAPACNSNNSAMMMPSSVICNQITAAPDSTDGLLSSPKVAGQCWSCFLSLWVNERKLHSYHLTVTWWKKVTFFVSRVHEKRHTKFKALTMSNLFSKSHFQTIYTMFLKITIKS